eukprot:c11910_g3_i1.p1 GENE.c11910_g3_i1~~c11910_g3_i1.p1  ORF type:complete len:255 (-),score=72.07 c11910_g3_i1:52-786(-)
MMHVVPRLVARAFVASVPVRVISVSAFGIRPLSHVASVRYYSSKMCHTCLLSSEMTKTLWTRMHNPTPTSNAFSTFELTPRFALDTKALEQKFREMQICLHPDKVAMQSKEVRDIAESVSSALNEAYHMLKSPTTRAQHLLAMHGYAIGESMEGVDPDVLEEVLLAREEIADATSPAQISRVTAQFESKLSEALAQATEAFDVARDFSKARQITVLLKYYSSILVHARYWEMPGLARMTPPHYA